MTRWKVVSGVVAVAAATALCVGVAMAQQRGGGMGGGAFDPAQWRQRIAERMKETLGATDEEWNVIGPRLEKVQDLSRQVRGGMGMWGMFGGGRMGRGGEGAPALAAAPQGPQSDVEKAATALQTVLGNQASTTDQIKEGLTAYREAREKGRDELAKAQDQLREVLNLRQEAQLVMWGFLD
jgi:hypothetical protein